METQQKQSVEENPLAPLTTEELGDNLAGAKMAIRNTEEYIEELKTELLTRLPRGEVLYVQSPEVQVGDEVVRPLASVTIRHKSRTTTTVPMERVIRALEADHPQHAKRLIQKTVVPAVAEHVELSLDKVAFLKAIEDDDKMMTLGGERGISALQHLVTVKESDWIEVGGLPK